MSLQMHYVKTAASDSVAILAQADFFHDPTRCCKDLLNLAGAKPKPAWPEDYVVPVGSLRDGRPICRNEQAHSCLATPNGQKVGIMLEELGVTPIMGCCSSALALWRSIQIL
eukprot:883014-Amphidinium_carterae.1